MLYSWIWTSSLVLWGIPYSKYAHTHKNAHTKNACMLADLQRMHFAVRRVLSVSCVLERVCLTVCVFERESVCASVLEWRIPYLTFLLKNILQFMRQILFGVYAAPSSTWCELCAIHWANQLGASYTRNHGYHSYYSITYQPAAAPCMT